MMIVPKGVQYAVILHVNVCKEATPIIVISSIDDGIHHRHASGRAVAASLLLIDLWLLFKCFVSTLSRMSRLSVNDVLQHLDTDERYDSEMAEGSDDDLGMDSVYDCDSDSSEDGIIQ